jgi:hypothetical protein
MERKSNSLFSGRRAFEITTGWEISIEGVKYRDNSGNWKIRKFRFLEVGASEVSLFNHAYRLSNSLTDL